MRGRIFHGDYKGMQILETYREEIKALTKGKQLCLHLDLSIYSSQLYPASDYILFEFASPMLILNQQSI